MSSLEQRRYAPREALALEPAAFGLFFDRVEPKLVSVAGVPVVDVRGPLMHHDSWWWDSYEAITERVRVAMEGKPPAVVLRIDSPGGLVSGLYDTVAALRAMSARAGVPLLALVADQATSAAYALACAAERIAMPAGGSVGSIGVIDTLFDVTAADAQWGVKYALVKSGARKDDGHPHVPISEEALAASQKCVDELAELFFDLVAEARGIGADEVRALEAGIVRGAEAQRRGLVDDVVDGIKGLLASAGVKVGARAAAKGGRMASKYEDALDALREVAEGEGEEAEKAKRMLNALEDEDMGEDDEEEDDDGGEEAKALVDANRILAARLQKLEGQLAAMHRAKLEEEVDQAIASGRAMPGERDGLLRLAATDRELFAQVTSRQAIPTGRVSGAGEARGSAKDAPQNKREEYFVRSFMAAGLSKETALELARAKKEGVS